MCSWEGSIENVLFSWKLVVHQVIVKALTDTIAVKNGGNGLVKHVIFQKVIDPEHLFILWKIFPSVYFKVCHIFK